MGNNGGLLKNHMEKKHGWTDIASIRDPQQLEEAKRNCCIFKWDCFRGCPYLFEPGKKNLNNHQPNNYWVQSKVKSKQLVYELKEWQKSDAKRSKFVWVTIAPPVDHWQAKSWESHSIDDMLEVINFHSKSMNVQGGPLKLIAKAHQSDRGENIYVVFDPSFMKRQQGKMILGNQQEKVYKIEDKAKREQKQAEALMAWIESRNTIQPQLIQTYMEHPMKYKGVKFDIRQYILCVRTEPYTVLWHDGFLLTAIEKQQTTTFPAEVDPYVQTQGNTFKENPKWWRWWEKEGMFVHLTNGSIQRMHKDYQWKKDSTKVPLSALKKDMDEQGQDDNVLDIALDKMRSASTGLFMMAAQKFARHLGLFEIFGLDFLLDENANPQLLEVNAIPNLSTETPLQKKVKGKVLPEMIDMLVDMHPEFFSNNSEPPNIKDIMRDGWVLLGDEKSNEQYKPKQDHSKNWTSKKRPKN